MRNGESIKITLIPLGPKNYAEWRSSWRQPRSNHRLDSVANAEGGENILHNDIYTEVKLYDISGNHCSTILLSYPYSYYYASYFN